MFKDWKYGVFHDILMNTLEPLRRVMEDGINLMCPDGQRRLCFPVLAQYIADYEEQRVLASILSGYCPKCTIPRYHKLEGKSICIATSKRKTGVHSVSLDHCRKPNGPDVDRCSLHKPHIHHAQVLRPNASEVCIEMNPQPFTNSVTT